VRRKTRGGVTVKKWIAFLLVALMMISLAACGEDNNTPSGADNNTNGTNSPTGNTPGNSSGGGLNSDTPNDGNYITPVTEENYKSIIKQYYGVDFELPDGWDFKEGEWCFGAVSKTQPNYTFRFNYLKTYDDIQTFYEEFSKDADDFSRYVFALTAPKGNLNYYGESIGEVPALAGKLTPNWYFHHEPYNFVMVTGTYNSPDDWFVAYQFSAESKLESR
jgi:hypothetical protein